MAIIYITIAQILSPFILILAVIGFILMLNAWSRGEEPKKFILYIVLTSLLIAIFITLAFYGFRVI